MVVTETFFTPCPKEKQAPCPVVKGAVMLKYMPLFGGGGSVADVVLIEPATDETVVVPPVKVQTVPHTSQSPAVIEIDVTSFAVPLTSDTADPDATVDSINCPICPAADAVPLVTPAMPPDGVSRPVIELAPAVRLLKFAAPEDTTVVKLPVLGVVAPIVALLIVPPEIAGVVSAGLVPNTRLPDPVSSLITPASCADVVAAN